MNIFVFRFVSRQQLMYTRYFPRFSKEPYVHVVTLPREHAIGILVLVCLESSAGRLKITASAKEDVDLFI